jgi:hypothetical protein
MNVEIGAEAALFPEKEYIYGIFVAVLKGQEQLLERRPTPNGRSKLDGEEDQVSAFLDQLATCWVHRQTVGPEEIYPQDGHLDLCTWGRST